MKLEKSSYVRVYSDLHLDFDVPSKNFKFEMLWMPEELETDKETTLILAGDLWHAKKPFSYFGKSWLKEISKKFQYILIVLGNHDFWEGTFPSLYKDFEKKLKEQKIENIFLIQDSVIEIGNHKFLGGTLWTDYLGGDALCMHMAENGAMKDYKYIKYGLAYQKVHARNFHGAHIKTKDFIFTNAKKDNSEQKIWVLTHHLPSFKSIPEEYRLDESRINENALYYSNLDLLIENSEIDYWVHGHSHLAQNYFIGNTRIIANPRGYTGEDTNYNPWFLIKL
jgi:predicted phosphodiesterase